MKEGISQPGQWPLTAAVKHWQNKSFVAEVMYLLFFEVEFEDTKAVIRIRISKNRQHNGQKIKYKRTNNDQQKIHIKLKIE